ncbi:DinB family protein [Kitasatospora brasiliensis]|uniref:DinB family protein n=1 Tax=Kitasatospora brasiliensis TaxID=3058040 RepID=UPI00292FBE1F|nr:DinB family protein [Kitasatospora sp. K002]
MGGEPMGEREELVEALDKHRGLLRRTVRELTDQQAAERTTVSELCLGGLIKHVAGVEARWARFMTGGAEAMRGADGDWGGPGGPDAWAAQFRMAEGDTLAGLLAEYERVARGTDELVRTLPDLGLSHPLPQAPWFPPGAVWSARRVLLHLIAETAQHAGHADIIRESLDGAKSMG